MDFGVFLRAMDQNSPIDLYDLSRSLQSGTLARKNLLVQIFSYVRELDPVYLAARSKETTTHFVWVLEEQAGTGMKLCLHQFKHPQAMGAGHANTIHNHRYDFLTLVLGGGYTEETYEFGNAVASGEYIRHIPEPAICDVRAGDSKVVDYRAFHRIPLISPETVTLVVKAPPKADHSMSISTETRVAQIHHSVRGRVQNLVGALARLAA